MTSTPLTRNPAADAARAVAAALAGSGSEWRAVAPPDDLGSSAALTIRRGARRQPGDPSSAVDTVEGLIVHFSKEPEQR